MEKNVNAYDFDESKKSIMVFCLIGLIILSLVFYFIEDNDQNEQIRYVVDYTLSQMNESEANDSESDEESSYVENIKVKLKKLCSFDTVFRLLKELGIIFVSILLSSLITIKVVEKKEKNKIYSEAVSDFFDENRCRLDISDLSKTHVQFYNEIVSKNIPDNLAGSVLGKICSPKEMYYYTDYEIKIECRIEDNNIIKNITEEISLRSYSDSYEFDKDKNPFTISEIICGTLSDGSDNIEVKDFRIEEFENTNLIQDVVTKPFKEENVIHEKMEYDLLWKSWLNYSFIINNENDTKLIIKYTTKVPLQDKMFTLHFPCACENAKISFSLLGKAARKYRVCGSAFGFIDNAENTYNNNEKKDIVFEFKKWSFKGDGAVIGIMPLNK